MNSFQRATRDFSDFFKPIANLEFKNKLKNQAISFNMVKEMEILGSIESPFSKSNGE